jgi:hypothetical protein
MMALHAGSYHIGQCSLMGRPGREGTAGNVFGAVRGYESGGGEGKVTTQEAKLSIVRERYIIVRDGAEVFCGIAKHYQFKPFDNIGDTAVKTYRSEAQAISAFNRSWHEEYDSERYQVRKVVESVMEVSP